MLAAAALAAAGCNYGFQGGGFPPHVETIYIEPLDNETVQFGLEQQVYDALVNELPGRLGVQTAGREVADAIVSGRIARYDDAAQNLRAADAGSGTRVIAHRVRLGVAIRILDVGRNVILWESTVTGEGTYRPGSQGDDIGIAQAIEDVVQEIIDGAQSQW